MGQIDMAHFEVHDSNDQGTAIQKKLRMLFKCLFMMRYWKEDLLKKKKVPSSKTEFISLNLMKTIELIVDSYFELYVRLRLVSHHCFLPGRKCFFAQDIEEIVKSAIFYPS
eukprot:Nk52_evm2s1311 gene=Nk52_evmTU2s1311